MNVWILNHYAITPDMPGGTRHFDLARELVQMGYDVTIFASAFNHSCRGQIRRLSGVRWLIEQVDGVKFIWLPSFAYQRNNWRRVINMLDYTWRAYWWGRRLPQKSPAIQRPDVVIGCAVHLFAVLAGYHLARHYRAHFLMEVRDLWPQTFLDMGVWHEGQWQVRFFRWLEQFLYARAERIITLSPMTRDYLAQYSQDWADKVVYIPNATRVARSQDSLISQTADAKPQTVMYLGAMGPTNGLDLVLDAIRQVNESDPGLLKCVFVGDGPEKQRLQQKAKDWRLENVRFEKAIPRNQVPERLAQADFLVLVQKEVLYGSSNKLYDYMASGKPIVVAIFAEHNNPIKEAGCGLSAKPDSAQDLADKLRTMARLSPAERQAMGQRGRTYVEQHHDYADHEHSLQEPCQRGSQISL